MSNLKENRDLYLLVTSRLARSFAGGILSVIIGLYYKYQLHLSLALIGVLFGIGALFTPLLTLWIGRYADRHGRKKLLLLTLAFLPTAVLIMLSTSNFVLLAVSAALGGFGIAGGLVGGGVGASVAPMQTALLAEKTNSSNRTLIFSAFTIVSSVAGSAGALLSNISNYYTLFGIALLFSLMSFAMVVPIRETFRPRKRNENKTVTDRKDSSLIRKFAATGMLNGASQGLIIPFLPIILRHQFLLTNGEVGDLFAAGGVITASSMILTPYLTARLGFVRFIISTRIISTLFTLAFPFAVNALFASLSYLIFTVFRAMALPSQQSLMMNLVSEQSRAFATGTNQSARLFPAVAASLSSGAIQEAYPVSIPFEAAVVLSFFNVYLYHRFFGKVPEANRAQVITHTD
jgi:MFS family permease